MEDGAPEPTQGDSALFPPEADKGEKEPSTRPPGRGGLPLSRGPGGLCRQRWAGTARPLGLDSLFFPLQGLGEVGASGGPLVGM